MAGDTLDRFLTKKCGQLCGDNMNWSSLNKMMPRSAHVTLGWIYIAKGLIFLIFLVVHFNKKWVILEPESQD
jgi:hypothetical protein